MVNPQQNTNTNNKDRVSDKDADLPKNPAKTREANKINPDNTKGKDNCGC